jgi:hypothetical protein
VLPVDICKLVADLVGGDFDVLGQKAVGDLSFLVHHRHLTEFHRATEGVIGWIVYVMQETHNFLSEESLHMRIRGKNVALAFQRALCS